MEKDTHCNSFYKAKSDFDSKIWETAPKRKIKGQSHLQIIDAIQISKPNPATPQKDNPPAPL
jgi:hypothetical protein